MTEPADRPPGSPPRRVPCVGAVVRDDRDRLLLVRRRHPPGQGQWSIPGGRVEPGESAYAAVVREVREETSLRVVVTGLAGVVERDAPDGSTYVIEDHLATLAPGSQAGDAVAGDDAMEVGWFTDEELLLLDCVEGLLAALRSWQLLR